MIDTTHQTDGPLRQRRSGLVTAAVAGDTTATAEPLCAVCRSMVARSQAARSAGRHATVRAETARAAWRQAATDDGASGGACTTYLLAQCRWTDTRASLAEHSVVDDLAAASVDIHRYAGSQHDDSSAAWVEVES